MRIDVYHHFGPDAATLLRGFSREVLAALNRIEEGMTTMNTQMTRAIADVAKLKDVVQASNAAWDIAAQHAADQAAKIADLEAKLAAGEVITAEDMAALSTANDDFEAAIGQIKTAVPANT